ncbi:MAG: TlpA family protein disulfide reductase [Magnetococcales bacterium]|nr:TlpA family protein disulfide reductase [Magnetococcales bacterium]
MLRSFVRLATFLVLFGPLILASTPEGLRAEEPGGVDTSLERLNGSSMRLTDLRGKLVLVNFWATWCPPCLKEIPDFVRLQTEFEKRDFVIIGANIMERADVDRLTAFANRLAINYPIVFATEPARMMGFAGSLGGVRGLPTSILLDREGRVVETVMGGMDLERMRNLVRKHLGEEAKEG